MASQYQPDQQDPYSGYFQESEPPPAKRSIVAPIVLLVFFIIALILLVIFVIYWFALKGPPPWVVSCEVNTDCFPGNICTEKKECEVVQCDKQSVCDSKVPGSFCIGYNDSQSPAILGYCQMQSCYQNTDCKDDEACIVYDKDYNWGSYCAKVGINCEDDNNCYGGKQQGRTVSLTCNSKKCGQCTKNDDCPDTNYCDVGKGLCINCIEDLNNNDTNPGCAVCGSDGVCCKDGKGPYYNGRCKIGVEFDYCINNSDCGISDGTQLICESIFNNDDTIKICKKPSGCLFSKNTLYNSLNNFKENLVCGDDAPFCTLGTINQCSRVSTSINGSLCGAPSKCSNGNYTKTSILCDPILTFNNPYQPFCTKTIDCNKYGDKLICNNGICEKPCVSNDDCLDGQICNDKPNINANDVRCNEDGKNCFCRYPTETVLCNASTLEQSAALCPKSFACFKDPRTTNNICGFATPDKDSSYPPINLVNNFCSTPASNLVKSEIDLRGGFCVGGICSQSPGWMGNNCELNNDCMIVSNNPLSFICVPQTNNIDMSICKVPS